MPLPDANWNAIAAPSSDHGLRDDLWNASHANESFSSPSIASASMATPADSDLSDTTHYATFLAETILPAPPTEHEKKEAYNREIANWNAMDAMRIVRRDTLPPVCKPDRIPRCVSPKARRDLESAHRPMGTP